MSKQTSVFAIAAIFATALFAIAAKKSPSVSGAWQVDVHHSDAQLVTDGTTDYGKNKIDVPIGIGRLEGASNLDADSSKSSVDLHIYPAMSTLPSIAEDGNFKDRCLANLANQTLLCFHSKEVVRTPDGKLKTTGDLILVRVDRNLEATPSEAYAGPVYGPPMIHRVSQKATFVFDLPSDTAHKDGGIELAGSTKVFREDFPQQSPRLPADPGAQVGEGYAGPRDFNAVTGERVNIAVHVRLLPGGSGAHAMSGN